MIHEYEVPAYITGMLPDLKTKLDRRQPIYTTIQVLTDYTKRMALEHNFREVIACMILVDRIYQKGNALVRNAVENIFIYSFSSVRMLCNLVEWRIVQSYMPTDLYMLYMQQVMRSGN